MLACSAATATSERYSLMKPSPTLKPTIAAMIAPVGGVARGGGNPRRGEQQDEQRVAKLAAQDPNGGHLVGGQHVAADGGQPAGGLVSGEAGLGAAHFPEHRAHRLTGSSRKVERRPLQRRG
jgi:hypothetical protein